MNADGMVVTDEKCETNSPGVYVIGDLREKFARQIVLGGRRLHGCPGRRLFCGCKKRPRETPVSCLQMRLNPYFRMRPIGAASEGGSYVLGSDIVHFSNDGRWRIRL